MADRRILEKKTFSFDEAASLLSEVRRITERAHRHVEELRGSAGPGPTEAERFESEATAVVNDWANGIRALGADVKGIWLVDFDNGSGYYCWRWPEEGLQFYHSYEEGFAGRMRIQ